MAQQGDARGNGLELARLFAQNNYDLVIAAEDAGIEDAAAELRGLGVNVEPVQVVPETVKAEQHRNMAEPGSGSK